jgi:predicted enzyme related to lactoylglutathione lyase
MSSPGPVVHLELHTGDQARASAFYAAFLLVIEHRDDIDAKNNEPGRIIR